MAQAQDSARGTVVESKEGPLGEQQRIVFRNSYETLHGHESRKSKPSLSDPAPNRLEVTFSQQLDAEKLRIDEPQTAVVGGKYINEEDNIQNNYELTKFDFDLPLTITEEVEDNGDKLLLLHFPEGDKDDPFNCNPKRKHYISVLLCAMTLIIGMATTAYSAGMTSMCEEFGVPIILGQMGLFVFNATCAIVPLILAPLCELSGRYIIYVGSYAGFCVLFIGLALGKYITTILLLRTILGLFGCVGTILVGGTFSDIYYSDKRAIPIASFSWAAIFGTVGAPIYAAFINMTIGWRWIEATQGFANVPLLVLILLTFKETRGEKTGDKRYVCAIDLDARNVKDLMKAASLKAVHMLATELVVFAFELWIAFAWFITFLFLSVIPITFMEKRGWNEGVAGLPYVSLALGVTLAFGANFLNMKKYKQLCVDPNLIVVPEHRLFGAMCGGLALPVGLFIYSFTQYGHLSWVGPTIALAPISFGIFFIFESCYSYTSDCYGESSGSAIAGQGLMRNMLGAVAPLFATAFFKNLSSQYAGLLLALLATLLSFIPWVFYKYGRILRQKSKMADCPEDNVKRSTSASASVRLSKISQRSLPQKGSTRLSISY